MTPTCVAARPMPSASFISRPIRRASSASSSSKVSISSARLRSTGPPYLRTSRSAASRRALVSGSRRSWSSSASSGSRGGIGSSPAIGTRSLLRVDVDAEGDFAVSAVARGGLHGGAGRGDGGRAFGGLDDELEALPAAQAEEWRGAEDLGGGGAVHAARDGGGRGPRGVDRVGARDDPDQVGERRVGERAAALELAGEEAARVVAGGGGDRGGVGRAGLHEHAAALGAAAGPARELRDQRERALLRAEVGEAQRAVRVENDAERHVGEVVALGDHLGSEQQAR